MISLLISLGVAIYSWKHRIITSATEYSIVAFAQSFWTAGFILELISRDIDIKIFWDNIQWIGTFVWPMAFLAFVLKYTGKKITHPKLFWSILSIIPIISMILVFTSDSHSLIRSDTQVISGMPFSELHYEFALIVILIAIYLFILALSGIVILIITYFHLHRLFRIQTRIIIIGIIFPIVGSLLTLFNLAPTFHRDMTPVTAAIGNLFVLWGLFRYKLLDIVPVARDLVVKSMRDLVIVLDSQNRVIDINDAVLRVLNKSLSQIIGKPARQVFSKWSNLLQKYRNIDDIHTELKIKINNEFRHFDFNLSPIVNQSNINMGRLIVLRDISKRVTMAEELKEHQNRLEKIVKERTSDLMASNKKSRREIIKRKKMEIEIRSDLKVKEALLKEIHHRVKNNLQIISSLLRLQSEELEDPQLMQIFYDCQNRIKCMALLHEHLYQNEDLNNVDFKKYILNLMDYLYKVYNIQSDRIKLTLNIKIQYVDLDFGIPCGLVINELVSNILKYAFPSSFTKKPEISITFQKIKDNKKELIVRDNGIGLPKNLDYNNTQTLGLRLVRILIEDQLNGEMVADIKKGAKFIIIF